MSFKLFHLKLVEFILYCVDATDSSVTSLPPATDATPARPERNHKKGKTGRNGDLWLEDLVFIDDFDHVMLIGILPFLFSCVASPR